MYDYIDSNVTRLKPGSRFFLSSAREWVRAAADGRCVCNIIRKSFRSFGVPSAEPHFHRAMRIIHQNALIPLYFGTRDKPHLTEHEAMLLAGLARSSLADREALHVARGLVHADMAPALAGALAAVAAEIKRAGHPLGTIEAHRPPASSKGTPFDNLARYFPASLRKAFAPEYDAAGRGLKPDDKNV